MLHISHHSEEFSSPGRLGGGGWKHCRSCSPDLETLARLGTRANFQLGKLSHAQPSQTPPPLTKAPLAVRNHGTRNEAPQFMWQREQIELNSCKPSNHHHYHHHQNLQSHSSVHLRNPEPANQPGAPAPVRRLLTQILSKNRVS